MHPRHFLLFAIPVLASAQQAVLPARSHFTESWGDNQAWQPNACHFQLIYDAGDFTSQGVTGPVLIYRLRFRAADGVVSGGGSTYATVNVHLSSSPADYTFANPLFAINRGNDDLLCYSGPVTTLPVTGTAPNGDFIDIFLGGTPFSYDPSLGADLVIEVDATAPSGPVPLGSTTNQRCRRVAAAATNAATGTPSILGSNVLLDFVGSGGYSTWAQATSVTQGTGCYQRSQSYYEEFVDASLLDLSNRTITMTPTATGAYDVAVTGATAFFAHGAAHLGLTDDAMALRTLPAGFGSGFPFPGPSGMQRATQISICSNGYISLGNDPYPDYPDIYQLLSGTTAKIAPLWLDLVPDSARNVYYDVDPSGTAVYVTYNAVPSFTAGGIVRLQAVLRSNGMVEYRFGVCVGPAFDNAIVGWSPGIAAWDPGSRDLSLSPPFATDPIDSDPLALTGTTPLLGTTLVETIDGVPSAATFSVRLIATTALPGIDLAVVGAPRCALWIDPATAVVTTFSTAGPTVTFIMAIPNLPALVGITVYGQAAAAAPGVNAFGMITSNQLAMTLGNS